MPGAQTDSEPPAASHRVTVHQGVLGHDVVLGELLDELLERAGWAPLGRAPGAGFVVERLGTDVPIGVERETVVGKSEDDVLAASRRVRRRGDRVAVAESVAIPVDGAFNDPLLTRGASSGTLPSTYGPARRWHVRDRGRQGAGDRRCHRASTPSGRVADGDDGAALGGVPGAHRPTGSTGCVTRSASTASSPSARRTGCSPSRRLGPV